MRCSPPVTTYQLVSCEGKASTRACAPQPKFGLCMKSGAMMSVISLRALFTSTVGMMPRMVPLLGSTAMSGTGSTGQVVGFSQLVFSRGAGFALGAGIGPETFGVRAGVVGALGGVPCGAAAAAARQSGAAATSPSAARTKRLELCLPNAGPFSVFPGNQYALRGVGPRLRFE